MLRCIMVLSLGWDKDKVKIVKNSEHYKNVHSQCLSAWCLSTGDSGRVKLFLHLVSILGVNVRGGSTAHCGRSGPILSEGYLASSDLQR